MNDNKHRLSSSDYAREMYAKQEKKSFKIKLWLCRARLFIALTVLLILHLVFFNFFLRLSGRLLVSNDDKAAECCGVEGRWCTLWKAGRWELAVLLVEKSAAGSHSRHVSRRDSNSL